MLIDTHCHLDFSQFDIDRAAVIQRARETGVAHMINVGADLRGSEASLALAKEHSCFSAAVGIHPHYAAGVSAGDIRRIEDLSRDDAVVAIGEVGLDYFGLAGFRESADAAVKAKQQEVFRVFIEIAQRRNLPLVVHCRDAGDDLLAIIRENRTAAMKAVVHCFSGDKDFLGKCLDQGLYISFTANVTYPNAKALRALIGTVPLDRIMIETDAPFLAPQPMRGKRNEPAFITYVAREIAQAYRIDEEKAADVTTGNARGFFGIKDPPCQR